MWNMLKNNTKGNSALMKKLLDNTRKLHSFLKVEKKTTLKKAPEFNNSRAF